MVAVQGGGGGIPFGGGGGAEHIASNHVYVHIYIYR